MSIAFGSIAGELWAGSGEWNTIGVLEECCLAMTAAKHFWLRNKSIFLYHPFSVVGMTSNPKIQSESHTGMPA